MKRFPLIAWLLFWGAAAWADESVHDRVSLSASASAEVANDTLEATLFVQEEGRDTARLARRVDETMQRALAIARKSGKIDARSEDYRTEPVYENNRIHAWRVRQTLRLKSRDFDALGDLVGRLQSLAKVAGMRFSVSDEARAKAEERLTRRAIEAFRRRARMIARSFGRSGYRLIEVDIGASGAYPPPIVMNDRAMLAEAAPSRPALAAGRRRLSVSVRGRVELRPGH